MIDDFLAGHPEFGRDDPRPYLPARAGPLVGDDDALRTAPDRGGLDGFYAVRLLRSPRWKSATIALGRRQTGRRAPRLGIPGGCAFGPLC